MQLTLAGLGRLDSEMEAGIDSPVGRPRTYDAAIEAEPEPAAVAAAAAPAPPISFKIGFKRRSVDAVLPADTTIGEVEVQVERQLQIPSGKQKLLYKGKKLESHLTLAEAGIGNKARLMLMGKVEEGGALRRTFTAETYDKLLANPGLAEAQRATLAAQAEQPSARPVTEIDVFLERSESRRKLAAARRELDALRKLNDPESTGLSRTQSEMARLRAVALQKRTAEELDAVRSEVVALRAELGLAPPAASGALDRTASEQAEYDLQLAIAMSQQDTWDEDAAAAELAVGAALTRTASEERGMAPPPEAQEGRLVRQRSDVAPGGGPVAPDPAATAASPRGKKGKKKKAGGGYAAMMSEAMQTTDQTDAERAAQAQARLAAKLVAPEKIVKGNRGLDRI
jgi:hypothetical protein